MTHMSVISSPQTRVAHFFEIEVRPELERLSLKIWRGPRLIVDWFTTDIGGLKGGRVGMYSHSQVVMLLMIMMNGDDNILLFAGPHLLDKPQNGEPSSPVESGWLVPSQRETVFNNRYNTENKGDHSPPKLLYLFFESHLEKKNMIDTEYPLRLFSDYHSLFQCTSASREAKNIFVNLIHQYLILEIKV